MNTPASTPLEGDWVERPVAVTVEGRTVTGTAWANWGAVTVAIASPIAGPTRTRDGRGWCFAMMCGHRPQERFALGAAFTAKGVAAAETLLAGIYLDWLAVSRDEADADAACRRTRLELAYLERLYWERAEPLRRERAGLRERLRSGDLSQRDHQRLRKALGEDMRRLESDGYQARQAALERFEAEFLTGHGRRVSLDEAERLLTDVARIVDMPEGGMAYDRPT